MNLSHFIFISLVTLSCSSPKPKMNTTQINFSSAQEAKALLTQEDVYTKSWSQFDIDSRMGKPNSTKEELFEFIGTQSLDWTDGEKEKISMIMEKIDARLRYMDWNISKPEKIDFVKTSGLEEGGAVGYTRSNYIVLKAGYLSSPKLQDLVTHEYFHVLSRHDAEFKRRIYGVIGFEMMEQLDFPKEHQDFRITNPDAPLIDSYISVSRGDDHFDATMILYSDKPYTEGSFFEYMQIGFLKLTHGPTKDIFYEDGKPVIYSMDQVSKFYEQVGRNTEYIIHPEEILAENFVYAIHGKKNLPDQHLVEKIKKVLK